MNMINRDCKAIAFFSHNLKPFGFKCALELTFKLQAFFAPILALPKWARFGATPKLCCKERLNDIRELFSQNLDWLRKEKLVW